jgi:hypothetical protein
MTASPKQDAQLIKIEAEFPLRHEVLLAATPACEEPEPAFPPYNRLALRRRGLLLALHACAATLHELFHFLFESHGSIARGGHRERAVCGTVVDGFLSVT